MIRIKVNGKVNKVIHGDCIEVMKGYPDNYFDSVVTDPPYGISFMNKHWDYDVPSIEIWRECLRVLKPGGHLLSFGGTRTYHRMACAIEDAGFEIRDIIAWVYGSGFPKSLNIGKAVDKLQGNEREYIGIKQYAGPSGNNRNFGVGNEDEGENKRVDTKGTSEWEGWGTALKPALEPITVARKHLSEKTVAENVLKWGTGGINIDGCRVEINPEVDDMLRIVQRKERVAENWKEGSGFKNEKNHITGVPTNGRFPANVIHDGSEEVVREFPDTKSGLMKEGQKRNSKPLFVSNKDHIKETIGDSGSASRFFYCAKSSRSERNKGCEEMEDKHFQMRPFAKEGCDQSILKNRMNSKVGKNNHPTVKPIALMQYLCRLITPPNGIVLDPFMGSGSTGIGAKREGFNFIGIEKEKEYCKIAEARISAWEVEKIIPDTQTKLDF